MAAKKKSGAAKTKQPRSRKYKTTKKQIKTENEYMEEVITDSLEEYEKNGTARDLVEQRYPGISGSRSLKNEIFMRLIQGYRLRRIPTYRIAEILSISGPTVASYMKKLERAYESEMGQFSVLAHVGRSIDIYRELQGMATQIASTTTHKPTPRIMALGTAIDAENRINALLKELGAFKAVRYVPTLSHTAKMNDPQLVSRGMAEAMFAGDMDMLDSMIEEAERPAEDADADDDLNIPILG